MKEITVILYGHGGNNAVISMPGRRFPGVVVQGDTLKSILDMSEAVLLYAKRTSDDELCDEAEALHEKLLDIYQWYEREAPPPE